MKKSIVFIVLMVVAGVIHGILLCLQVAYVAIFMEGREIISYLFD